MSVHPFAGFNPRPSAWGYNWTQDAPPQQAPVVENHHHTPEPPPPQPTSPSEQYANLPAALLSTLKREKKPFTYTPGGVNLSEVLNARLQKRMERKKKYNEEKTVDTPPKQVMIMPTYNTPLDMYSMANALEALEVQAELVAADKSLSIASPHSATLPRNHTFRFQDNQEDLDPGPRGATQSKAFRVLQIITDTEEGAAENDRVQHKDEMRFKGLRDSSAIPSKFFHTLQKMTGTEYAEEEDEEQESRVVRSQHFQSTPRPQSFPQQQRQPPASSSPADLRGSPVTVLKRPAAFLPIKTSPGFRPVQPPRAMANGRIAGHNAVTDF